jgi:hypothetical protein
MSVLFSCNDFAALRPVLSNDVDEVDISKRAAMTVEEILVANLGDSIVEPHLIVPRSINPP